MVKLITPEDASHCRKKPPAADMYPELLLSKVHIVVGEETNAKTFDVRKNDINRACPKLTHLLGVQEHLVLRKEDPKAFEQMLRHLQGQQLILPTVQSALNVLEVARRYLVPSLVKRIIIDLDLRLDKHNVISVYKYLHPFCSVTTRGYEPSAPPDEDNTSDSQLMQLYRSLYENCLTFLDKNAYSFLMGNDVEILSRDELIDIISRDTLYIKSEILILDAVMRWCDTTCKNMNMAIIPRNRKDILGKLRYDVRYGLLSKEDFFKRVVMIGILDDNECNLITSYQKNKQGTLPHKWAILRKKPQIQSCRIGSHSNITDHRLQTDNISMRSERIRRGFAQKFILNCLTLWTALFD